MAKTIDLLCTHAHHTHIPSWSFLWRVNVVKLWFGRIFFCTLCSFYIVGCVFLHIISNFFRFHQIQFRFFLFRPLKRKWKIAKCQRTNNNQRPKWKTICQSRVHCARLPDLCMCYTDIPCVGIEYVRAPEKSQSKKYRETKSPVLSMSCDEEMLNGIESNNNRTMFTNITVRERDRVWEETCKYSNDEGGDTHHLCTNMYLHFINNLKSEALWMREKRAQVVV